VRRVNVLPGVVEVVLADTAAAATCANQNAPGRFDTARPIGRVRNSDGTSIVAGVSVVYPRFGGVVIGPVVAR
jgi:hypothetical protein